MHDMNTFLKEWVIAMSETPNRFGNVYPQYSLKLAMENGQAKFVPSWENEIDPALLERLIRNNHSKTSFSIRNHFDNAPFIHSDRDWELYQRGGPAIYNDRFFPEPVMASPLPSGRTMIGLAIESLIMRNNDAVKERAWYPYGYYNLRPPIPYMYENSYLGDKVARAVISFGIKGIKTLR